MKQRITRKDLETLTEDQKRSLNALWTPSIYDAAVAKVLKNVATDEYDEYEFVIGGISLFGASIYLTDIVAGKAGLQLQSGDDTQNEEQVPPAVDPALAVKIDPVFGESYPGFGNREDLDRASEGMRDAMTDEDVEDEEAAEENQEADFLEQDLEDNYQHPAILLKGDCTPLLGIGNMIEILQNNNFGKFEFFLSASTYEKGCELGKADPSWGYSSEWKPAELCDVLWDSVKELL